MAALRDLERPSPRRLPRRPGRRAGSHAAPRGGKLSLAGFARRLLGRVARRPPPAPAWVASGQLSATGSELRYWRETGIARGTGIYRGYLDAFELAPGELRGAAVADFGAGPFGGLLSVLPDVAEGYPIDVLADEYNAWGLSNWPIRRFDGGPTDVPAGACDVAFCTNAIDHTPRPELVAQELHRILRPGGTLLLHVHLRRPDELNKIHPVPWTEATVGEVFAGFELVSSRLHDTDPVNGNPHRTLLARLRKQ